VYLSLLNKERPIVKDCYHSRRFSLLLGLA
jgi:hypothetical protein